MALRVVGVSGSPRKGNTEWMLRVFLEEVAESGTETELILLREMEIRGCDGCLTCEAGGAERKGTCRIRDDMEQVYPKLLKADGLALGTPVYFELLSGLLKNFMDRTCPIWPKLEGKPVVGIAVAEEGVGKALDNLRTYSSLCGMRWVGHVTALGKTPRQVSRDATVRKRLKRLAMKFTATLRT
ncbi:MAG: flavodoxin family protein [Chloroflexi bacterium]|nr:flavodoxin family protein [Chloroflexota bacterium]